MQMKIDLNAIDRESFYVTEHITNGQVCYLITPQHIGVKWNKDNLYFRSSLWDSDGNPINLSFQKFFNAGEHPDLSPIPSTLKDAYVVEKLDGSLLAISSFKNDFIVRTRGTVTTTGFDFGFEVDILKEKYPLAFNPPEGVTWLFEWLSDNQKIVLSYPNCPDMKMIGCINHSDYFLWKQADLDTLAKSIGVGRPEYYSFSSIEEMMNAVEKLQSKEGVVLYYDNQQKMLKIKAESYLKLHRFKSNATLENTLELFFTFGKPDFNTFKQKIGEVYDWECVKMVIGDISRIVDAWEEVQKILHGFDIFIHDVLSPLSTRKEQAFKIISSYGNSGRSSMIFKILDSRPLTDEDFKKLLYQKLKS